MKQIFLSLFLLLLPGCAARLKDPDANRISPLERKILTSVDSGRIGKSTGPIIIQQRKLTIREIGEHLDMDDEAVLKHLKATNVHGYYSLTARNLPPEGKFTLYHINYQGHVFSGKKFFVNGNGMLVTKLDDQYIELGNNFLFFSNYLPGEPANFAFVSDNQKLIATAKIIPNPIEASDSNSRRVSLEIASPDKRCYLASCSGLNPFENYLLRASFENEQFAYPFQANSKGEAFIQTGPNTPWINGGNGTLELSGNEITPPLFS